MDSMGDLTLKKDGNKDPPGPSSSEQIQSGNITEDRASKPEGILKAHKREDPRAFCGYLEDETTVKLDCCSRCVPYHGMCLNCWAPLPVEYGATPDLLSKISPTECD